MPTPNPPIPATDLEKQKEAAVTFLMVKGGFNSRGESRPDLDAKNFAKFETAYWFYREQGLDRNAIVSQVAGIDFNYNVTRTMCPPPPEFHQFQTAALGQTTAGPGRVGTYWAPIGSQPEELGISGEARRFDPSISRASNETMRRIEWEFKADPAATPVEVLRSVAAPIKDTWSLSTTVDCPGGGVQYFKPGLESVYKLTPGQENKLPPPSPPSPTPTVPLATPRTP